MEIQSNTNVSIFVCMHRIAKVEVSRYLDIHVIYTHLMVFNENHWNKIFGQIVCPPRRESLWWYMDENEYTTQHSRWIRYIYGRRRKEGRGRVQNVDRDIGEPSNDDWGGGGGGYREGYSAVGHTQHPDPCCCYAGLVVTWGPRGGAGVRRS